MKINFSKVVKRDIKIIEMMDKKAYQNHTMKNKIKTISTLCMSIFLACSCNETKSNNNSSKQNDNDVLYDSLSNNLQKSNLHCDSLRMIFEQELTGLNGRVVDYGPSGYKIISQMDSCKIVSQKIKVKLDSVFVLTSKEFKKKYYNKFINDLDFATTENKNNLLKLRESFEAELEGRGYGPPGYGPQAKMLKSEILLIEKQIQSSKFSKDSINDILDKIK